MRNKQSEFLPSLMTKNLHFLISTAFSLQLAFAAVLPAASHDRSVQIGSSLTLHFQYIPPGTYTRGSPPDEAMRDPDEGPQHVVTLTKAFYLGTYEVTQAQWASVMGENPAVFQNFGSSLQHPVESVSWNECQEFIRRLNAMGQGTFRLPTEAEWEYACRAGTQSPYYWGARMAESGQSDYAWANSRSFARTHPVGRKQPNPWGLYDMSGNVWEWCQDWYGAYPEETLTDPTGPDVGKLKVFRGGSWYDFHESHRSANRHKHAPNERYSAIGLRLVLETDSD
jgi:formylglycine-generating enzyme required for sulfatase activity